jgi:hypothetical protein
MRSNHEVSDMWNQESRPYKESKNYRYAYLKIIMISDTNQITKSYETNNNKRCIKFIFSYFFSQIQF